MIPQKALDDIADAILDGTPIDWSHVDINLALLEQLKTLETLRRRRRALAAPHPAGDWNWGHLRVLERIGQGAFGDVFRAWDTRLDREVALKLLPTDHLGDGPSDTVVIEEGRLMARVRHPNVATIYGAERIDGRVGLWMEFVKGRTLEEALQAKQTFTPADVKRLGVELCRAVAAVHAAGLLHRDIKAQNIMLDERGRLVLMDFGTGRAVDEATGTGVAGTPLYLAPEVLSGGAATPRSDIYGIGVVLFRLLTGSYPVFGANLDDLRRAHAEAGPADGRLARPQIPLGLRRVITRALDPDPEARYASADALAAALATTERLPATTRLTYMVVVAAAVMAALALGWNVGLRELARPALVALGVARVPAIAVLPFTNAGADPGNDHVIDGLTFDVIRNLSDIDGLEVRSLTSSFFFKGRPRDLRDVANRLNVDYVVEASVQRAGDRIRINAFLVRTADSVPVWSGTFERTLGDVFEIQREISLAIVNKLRLTIGRGQRRYQLTEAASELYYRGLWAVARRGTAAGKEAAQLFEQVIAMAPEFAPAHAGLAQAYGEWAWQPDGLSNDAALAGMRPAAEKALALDPLLAEAHAAMGITYARELNWEAAKASFERALDSPETLTHIRSNYAVSTLLPLGEAEKAQALLLRAATFDPLNPNLLRDLGMAQFVGRHYENAIATLREAVASSPEGATFGGNLLARALTFAGRPEEAIAVWENRRGQANWELWLLPAYLETGRRADFDRLANAGQNSNPYRQSRIFAALGDKDRTFEALNRAVEDVPHRVAFTLACPEMALLEGDHRLDALRKRLNMR